MNDTDELSFDDDNVLIPEIGKFYSESDIAGNYAGFEETVDECPPEEISSEEDLIA